MSLTSCLYECEIGHVRTKPKLHAFKHRHFMACLDLDEIESLQSRLYLFGKRWFSPYRFESQDHMPVSDSPFQTYELKGRVAEFARSKGMLEKIERILLVTNLRFLGYVFNPVSLFFCFAGDGRPLCCVVEVGNTFGEKKAYLVDNLTDGVFVDRQMKLFYVSPFTELTQDFIFRLSIPGDELNLKIDTVEGFESSLDGEFVESNLNKLGHHGELSDALQVRDESVNATLFERGVLRIVSSTMTGKRRALTDRNLFMLMLRYPCAPLQVIALIHFHAFLLWMKRIPFRAKEEGLAYQTNVWNRREEPRKPSQSVRSNVIRAIYSSKGNHR